jgi:hypothetical protein
MTGQVTGYDPAGWGDLLVCAGGAAAVLAGLIFVGLSVNMTTLLQLDKRRGRISSPGGLKPEVYGSCLAPAYPSQLLIALGHLGGLPIGAWRGQASIEWDLDPSLVRPI